MTGALVAAVVLAGLVLGVQQSNAASATTARAVSPAVVLARQVVVEARDAAAPVSATTTHVADETGGGGHSLGAVEGWGDSSVTPSVSSAHPFTLAPGQTVRVMTYQQWQWVRRWFPGNEWLMAKIATCESMWRDDVVGAAGERGRLQIHPINAARFGYSPADLADPEVNGWVGARILEELPDGSAWTGAAGCNAWSLVTGGGA